MSRAYGVKVLGAIEKPVTQEKLAQMIVGHRLTPRFGAQQPPAAAKRPSTEFTLDEIKSAILGDEIEPFFQPKVALQDGRVIGAEALARWRHPLHGVVPPGAFLPQIESTALIEPLTWTMLKKSALACRRWREAGQELPVAVNLSQSLLADRRLADRVSDLVREQGVEPRLVVLEVTESAAMADIGVGLENLTRLRMKGFGLSIDDYGTGFSSMQQLSRIPFSELKIDRSFVSGADRDEKLRVMIETSMMLASKLKLKFIAEGIETQAEWDTLRVLGCYAAQGYFIARPLDGDAFVEWLTGRGTPS